MKRSRVDAGGITREISGKSVSHVTQPDTRRLAIHFTDGSALAIELIQQRLAVALLRPADVTGGGPDEGPQPTRRQREYLEFIARYILRFGVSPAEIDIGRHFLVSAPSVNQMVQTLERRGFITRQRGVPRSISLVYHTNQSVLQLQPAAAGGLRSNFSVQRTPRRR